MAQTIEQFGQTIKAKYPQYNDIPDAELGQKMLAKYPQYSDMVDTSSRAIPSMVDTSHSLSNLPGQNIPVVSQAERFLLGVGASGVQTVTGLASAGLKGLGYLGGKIAGAPVKDFFNAGAQKVSDFTESRNKILGNSLPVILGKGAGEAAQLLAPTSAVSAAGKTLTKGAEVLTAGAPKVIQYGAKLAAHALPEAGVGGVYGLAKSNGNPKVAAETALTFGVLSGAFKTVGDGLTALKGDLGKTIGRSLGFTGKMGVDQAINKTATAATGLKILADNAAGTLVKDATGVEKVFEPTKATFGETLQAFKTAKDKVYNAYTDIAARANDIGARFTPEDFHSLIGELNSFKTNTTGAFKNKASSLIDDLRNNFGQLQWKIGMKEKEWVFKETELPKLQDFLQKVNIDVNPLSDKAANEVSLGLSRKIRDILDSKIEQATGEAYQATRSQYAALKSIENELVNQFKKSARGTGGDFARFLEQYGGLDIIVSALRGDLIGIAKGTGLFSMGALRKLMKDPEANLQRAFDMILNPDKQYIGVKGRLGAPTRIKK